MDPQIIRVDYDDQIDDVINKINVALEEHGLSFRVDDQVHDGFDLYELVNLNQNK